jgi:L,D-peptidoglycan transpeptidase YkuD (ErfK/YbiS/YcfS/YnhG family)
LLNLFLIFATVAQSSGLPDSTRQLLVVTTESWRSRSGSLQRYRAIGERWEAIGNAVPVSVGRNGLAWAQGTRSAKHEGDRCAPAGIFALGPAFGYAGHPPAGCKLSYRAITERDYFVDDPTSADYNRWVTIPTGKENRPEKFWRSFERMRRHDQLYELGIVIQQNEHPIVKGKGSAIFLHVWKSVGAPTIGCTAMARGDLVELLRWLDPKQKPLLVQAPASEIKNILAIPVMR